MIRTTAALVWFLALGAAVAFAADEAAHPERLSGAPPSDLAYTYGVGVFAPQYEAPAPGTYTLPVVDTVGDHPLLDVHGRATTLFAETGGRVAVVAFVYTTCIEATGCPLALAVLDRVDRALAADPTLARDVVLLAISFDPERDTPARMGVVRAFHAPHTDWRFLTAADETTLAPLLADFHHPVAKLRYPDGTWSGLFRHVLKAFLVDGEHRVRNVYSAGLLDASLVLNDARTVMADRSATAPHP